MSCLGACYLPVPARRWSRVQNFCTYLNENPPPTVTVPLIGTTIPSSALAYQVLLINKGNVLQYKKNSSNLTKRQIYSQIVQGKWTNRTTTWATQSESYSNPNTQHLKRVGGEWITGSQQSYCKVNLPKTNYVLPSIKYSPNNQNPIVPPPPPENGNPTNIIPVVDPDVAVEPEPILDFGNLICNTTENICTGETVVRKSNSNWHPTSDSDVPGTIIDLYWNNRIQTWYPKQRLTMNNSTDKWPQGAKFIGAANTTCQDYTPPIVVSVIPTINTALVN